MLLLSFVTTSCCKPIFRETFIIKNESSHTIQITRLRNNNIIFTITILPLSVDNPSKFYPIEICDSTVILFDGSVNAVHYSSEVKDLKVNTKALRIDDKRNINNINNYIVDEKNLACNGFDNIYTFQVTDQDYFNAVK